MHKGDLMKRLILTAAVVFGLAVPAVAQAAIPQPIYFWPGLPEAIRGPGLPTQPEVIRPSGIEVYNGGAWFIEHLHWTGWGSSVAHANGISNVSNGIPNQAQGKRIKAPAQLTLSNPGRFFGHEVYRCVMVKVAPPTQRVEHLCLEGHHGLWVLD